MMYAKISAVVKAIRLRYVIPLVLLLIGAYLLVIHPWMVNWGSTPAERQMALPGDELYPSPIGRSTWAITIHAPPQVIWQWLVQVGQDRAGFYTYTWLENLTGCEFHNANEIHPEWQTSSDLQAGLAAFIAVGITVLGFLIFGRDWWGSLLLIASIVLLTLLLASEAYIAIGFTFTLLVVAALITIITARPHPRFGLQDRLAEPTR